MQNEIVCRRWYDQISQNTLHSDEIIFFFSLPVKPLQLPLKKVEWKDEF